ncbi:MAG: S8 family serine peptidase, partial [Actinomycetota bacterium]
LQKVGDRVQVQIVARDSAAAKKALVRSGGGVQFAHRNLIQALAPISALKGLAEHPDIRRIESMRPPETFATAGQGVGAINASAWHQTGFTGTGVKIAVVDSGFAGYQARQTAGDLPQNLVAINKCANGFEATTEHGAGVAEIVHEVAPAASLYLICVDGPVGAAAAVTYAKDNGIRIISSSIGSAGWSRGEGSGGTGTWDAVVKGAAANGILWINAAGNYANGGHWSGNFSDADGDGLHNFTSTDEFNDLYMPAGAKGCVTLKWDNWPTSSNDFDLYLLRTSDAAVVAKSEYAQTGTEIPVEEICYENTGAAGDFTVAIQEYAATASPRFDMYTNEFRFEHFVASGSVAEPASSPDALGVGAVCWQSDSIESFSSQGPTIDGRTKPDIAAPDGVSSGTYGVTSGCEAGFHGTSAAAPHVAGAAALILQKNPTFGASDIRNYLESNALDRGTAGKDSIYGAGETWLPAGSTPSPTPTPTGSASPTPTETPSPTPTETSSPTPTASPTPTITPSPTPTPTNHQLDLTLRLRKHLIAKGTATASDGYLPCTRNAPVKIFKRVSGGKRLMKVVYTNEFGRFNTRLKDRSGFYFAVAIAGSVDDFNRCAKTSSNGARHFH